MEKIFLELPWSPSTNHTWQHGKGHIFLSQKTKIFRLQVALIVRKLKIKPIAGDLEVDIVLYPPDKRKRDEDNFAGKSLYDALTAAGVWFDDSQVKKKTVTMSEVVKGGKIVITIQSLRR